MLAEYYATYDEADWPAGAGPAIEDSHATVIRRYRRIRQKRSTARIVWGLGEALRRCGVRWMRGSILLYAFGHLDQLVGAYGTAGEDLVPYAGWLQYEINQLPELAAWSPLDRVIRPEQDRLLRRLDTETVAHLFGEYQLAFTPGEEFEEEVSFLGARQVIRDAHSRPPRGYTEALDRGWRRWNVRRDVRTFSKELLDALSVARSTGHSVTLRMEEVQRHLQAWSSIMLIQAEKTIKQTKRPTFLDRKLKALFANPIRKRRRRRRRTPNSVGPKSR